jgi:hypothetical protein
MKTNPAKPGAVEKRSLQPDVDDPHFPLAHVLHPLPSATGTAGQTPVSNTVRATTITVVLEEILSHSGYIHGGINE